MGQGNIKWICDSDKRQFVSFKFNEEKLSTLTDGEIKKVFTVVRGAVAEIASKANDRPDLTLPRAEQSEIEQKFYKQLSAKVQALVEFKAVKGGKKAMTTATVRRPQTQKSQKAAKLSAQARRRKEHIKSILKTNVTNLSEDALAALPKDKFADLVRKATMDKQGGNPHKRGTVFYDIFETMKRGTKTVAEIAKHVAKKHEADADEMKQIVRRWLYQMKQMGIDYYNDEGIYKFGKAPKRVKARAGKRSLKRKTAAA